MKNYKIISEKIISNSEAYFLLKKEEKLDISESKITVFFSKTVKFKTKVEYTLLKNTILSIIKDESLVKKLLDLRIVKLDLLKSFFEIYDFKISNTDLLAVLKIIKP